MKALIHALTAAARDSALDYIELMRSSLLFWAAGMLVTLGVALFGAAVLRARSYPATMGLTLLACPLVFVAVILLDGPPLIGFAANAALGIVFVAMGVRTMRRKT